MVSSKVVRVTRGELDGTFASDRGRRVIVAFVPGDGAGIPDTLTLRPHGTRRAETIAVVDVYRYALRCRVNRTVLEKAREKKSRKAARLASLRVARAERKLFAQQYDGDGDHY